MKLYGICDIFKRFTNVETPENDEQNFQNKWKSNKSNENLKDEHICIE